MIIRKASVNDIDDIVRIENEWKDFYCCWGKNGFIEEFKKDYSITFVAEVEGKIAGFINIWIIDDVEINSIVVSKLYLRRGIGSCLINRAIEEARYRNISRVILEVNKENVAAVNLYLKNGFEVYNIRKKYYDCKYDALMMEKKWRIL